MSSRKKLKNLACGLAGRFVSRNNDIDGYWALGVLYAVADHASLHGVQLDLLSGVSVPSFESSAKLTSRFYQYLQDHLAKLDLTGCVVSATIDIKFNVESLRMDWLRRTTWGEPYSCCAKITDDLGFERECMIRGCCGKHDANREHRSTRTSAS